MSAHPKIKIKKTMFDQTIDLINLSLLVIIWITVILNYAQLPETIPIHYNASGEIDGYGSKQSIFLLPAIATVLLFGIMVLNRFPHLLNYPASVNEENASRLYRNATRMMRFLSLFVLLTFGFLTFKDILYAGDSSPNLGNWFIPVVLIVFSAPVAYFLYSVYKKKANKP